LVINELVVVGT